MLNYCGKFEDVIFSIFKDMTLQSRCIFFDTQYVWPIHYNMLLKPASFPHLDLKELKGQPWMKTNKNMMSKTKWYLLLWEYQSLGQILELLTSAHQIMLKVNSIHLSNLNHLLFTFGFFLSITLSTIIILCHWNFIEYRAHFINQWHYSKKEG